MAQKTKTQICKTYAELDILMRSYGSDVHRTFQRIQDINKFEEGCSKKQAEAAILHWWNAIPREYDILHNCLAYCLLCELFLHLEREGKTE
jgi:hypothetical protein